MPVNNRGQQEGRDDKGRFKPGTSGNPSGRPAGASNRALLACREWAEAEGLPMLIDAARAGDIEVARFLLSLGIPRMRPVAMPESLPESVKTSSLQGTADKARAIVDAAIKGELSSDSAAAHLSLLLQAAKIEEVAELKAEIETLKRILERRT